MALVEHRTRKICGPVYTLNLNQITKDYQCIECRRTLSWKGHFSKLKRTCIVCSFATNCRFSYVTHVTGHEKYGASFVNNSVFKRTEYVLNKFSRCKCGFSTKLGNQLAKHMVQCEEEIMYCNFPETDDNSRNDACGDPVPDFICRALNLRPKFGQNQGATNNVPTAEICEDAEIPRAKYCEANSIPEYDHPNLVPNLTHKMKLNALKQQRNPAKSTNMPSVVKSGSEDSMDSVSIAGTTDVEAKRAKKLSVSSRERMSYFVNSKNRLRKAEHICECVNTVCEQYEEKRPCPANKQILWDALMTAKENKSIEKQKNSLKNVEFNHFTGSKVSMNNADVPAAASTLPVVIDLASMETIADEFLENVVSRTPSPPSLINVPALNIFENMENLLFSDAA